MDTAQSPKKIWIFQLCIFSLAFIKIEWLTPLQQPLRPLGGRSCEARLCIRMLVCSEVTGLKVKILGKWIFFLPSGKRRRQESFIRKCWRQDELLRKRPKRRKYLILPIVNKKTTSTDANCIWNYFNPRRDKNCPNGTNYVLCPHCTVINVRLPCIVGKSGSSVQKFREKPRIFHPKLFSNHAPVVDTISASRGYPLKRASTVIIWEMTANGKRQI